MTRTIVLVVALVVVGSACRNVDTFARTPSMTAELSAQLQARTFMRACRDVRCASGPILAPDTTPLAVREVVEHLTTDVEYVKMSQLDELYTSEGRFSNGAVMIDVRNVGTTERSDVVGVDVWISRGQYDVVGRTYLFLWNAREWMDTSPELVNVTVTTSVS